MASPNKPLKLEPSNVYLQIAHKSSDPSSLVINHSSCQLRYVGQVGELEGEGIFEVVKRNGQPVNRSEVDWTQGEKALIEEVKKAGAVKGVRVMPEMKQRAKRDEF